MTKYIVKQMAISALINEANTHSNPVKRAYTRAAAIVEQIPATDVKLVISGDNCIVCGHDVRKDNVYYDVNGGTICESCMNTKCKCKNGR